MKRTSHILFAVAMLLLVNAEQARSQIIPIALGGLFLSKLLDQAHDQAADLIKRGENSGNALLVKAGLPYPVKTG
jgi:hypothetical protein